MRIMNKIILFAIMSLLLLVTACNKNDDIERVQSMVFVPEHSSGCIRVDGTSPMTLRYRVEPKKMIPELVNNSKAFTFESKSLSEMPSLTINTITGDATSGVLTLEVTPSAGFEHNGDFWRYRHHATAHCRQHLQARARLHTNVHDGEGCHMGFEQHASSHCGRERPVKPVGQRPDNHQHHVNRQSGHRI